jgi:hypothetical protein
VPDNRTDRAAMEAACFNLPEVVTGTTEKENMMSADTYPRNEGDVTVLGPQVFASRDGAVINWRGENYTPQRLSLRASVNNKVRVPLIEAWRGAREAVR